jgi:hypothetical protein
VPGWLPELAEAIAGQRFNDKRMLEPVPISALRNLKQLLANSHDEDFYARWAKWFFADRSTRPVSPLLSMTVPEYIQLLIQENTSRSLHEAVLLSPTNGLAFARLASRALALDTTNPRHLGEADFYSQYALKWSPNDPEVQRIRAEIAERIRQEVKQ